MKKEKNIKQQKHDYISHVYHKKCCYIRDSIIVDVAI